jgi:hypothetical protein
MKAAGVRSFSITALPPVTPGRPRENEKLCPVMPLKSNTVTSPQRVESAVKTGYPTDRKADTHGR